VAGKGNPQDALTPRMSVIIPAKNEGAYIGACIESLNAVSAEGLVEIILVDNGSSDDTVSIAEAGGARVHRVLDGTVAALRNRGAEFSSAPVLAFVDADCTVDPGWVTYALAGLAEEGVCAAGCYPRLPEGDSTWVQRTWIAIARPPAGQPRETSWLPSANMVVDGAEFRRVGGFDAGMETAEDADLTYRLSTVGKVMYDERISAAHHREPRTLSAFLRKEIWHGLGTFDGVSKGRFTPAEMPSLIAPLMTIAGVLLLLVGWMVHPSLPWLGMLSWAFPPVAYTIRGALRPGVDVPFVHLLALYGVYHFARGLSVFYWIKKRMFAHPRSAD
jgi:glycosyltransferase involved in cell wall biosynthesis